MTNEQLKEEYFSTLEFYKQLEPAQQNVFQVRLNEVKELKNKALQTVSSVSKDYLFKQAFNKLKAVKNDILEQIKENNEDKYKSEIQRLQTVFQQREFNDREKEYLVKKIALLNGFDYKHFKIYIKENSKLFGSSIMSDVESLMSLS